MWIVVGSKSNLEGMRRIEQVAQAFRLLGGGGERNMVEMGIERLDMGSFAPTQIGVPLEGRFRG